MFVLMIFCHRKSGYPPRPANQIQIARGQSNRPYRADLRESLHVGRAAKREDDPLRLLPGQLLDVDGHVVRVDSDHGGRKMKRGWRFSILQRKDWPVMNATIKAECRVQF